ncbi:MAG: hypothetical protein AAB479_00045 [Patescibacteria group bacterium]
MYKSKKATIAMIVAVLVFGVAIGFSMARNTATMALADDDNGSKVDREDLEEIYQAAFGRSPDDDGEKFHLGKDLKQVLHDINNSDERRYYAALFKSVKAYEQAVRAPGAVSDADKQIFLNNINSALATLIAWVETLPEQNICKGVVGAEEARQAIQAAFDRMSPAAQAVAQRGIFKALDSIGGPKDQRLPSLRCFVTPSPSASPSPTPTT